MSTELNNSSIEIRQVWSNNLENEIKQIYEIVDKFCIIGMDTEFPGAPLRKPDIPYRRKSDEIYAEMKVNVNACNLIQLGLCLTDEEGNLPTCGSTGKQIIWQFNFKEFDIDAPKDDPRANVSIALLGSTGIDFKRYHEFGVDIKRFGELIMPSGTVLNHDNIQWVTFSGAYDFGYVIKPLTGKPLPETQEEFLQLVEKFFPEFYDVKHMILCIGGLRGSLSKVAQYWGVKRIGVAHNSASDSLLALGIFRKVKQILLSTKPDSLVEAKCVIHGLTLDKNFT